MAPAGDIEAGYAALYYGADAVYLGLKQFSARATAANFDEKQLGELTAYAHRLGRKVYAAVNTLIEEDELPDLLKQLDICSHCKVDAVIIQDWGTARIVREVYPELEMHASTQMAVHNKEGALALQKLGFSRVVTARELTRREIEEIAALPGLETEAFIHGALCYSYSGLCLFSSLESGKSANRGKCLYPCRGIFGGEKGEKHYFSMKDMALEEDILKMPVTSFKIEGRKKNALYVAAVTDYYRKILDGEGTDARRAENIRQIFSRPWCKFHFNGKDKGVIEPELVGHRGLSVGAVKKTQGKSFFIKTAHELSRYDGIQIDVPGMDKPYGFSLQVLKSGGKNVYTVPAGTEAEIGLPPQAPIISKGMEVYLASATAVKGAYGYEKPRPGAFKAGEPLDVSVMVSATGIRAEASGFCAESSGVFEKAEHPEKTAEAAEKAFLKTGGTPFVLSGFSVSNPEGRFVPASAWNDLRRRLYDVVRVPQKSGVLPTTGEPRLSTAAKWIIKTDQPEIISPLTAAEADEITIVLHPGMTAEALSHLPRHKLRAALPAWCRRPADFEPLAGDLQAKGIRKWEIGNPWGLEFLADKGLDISWDSSLYMLNSQAAAMAEECGASRITLSLEDNGENLKRLAGVSVLPVVMVVYQDVPLFSSAACIRQNACKECPRGEKRMFLRQKSRQFEVLSRDCQTFVLDEAPLCLAEEAADVKADWYRADFVYRRYSGEEADAVWRRLRSFKNIIPSRQGNWQRRI